jgi:hypothetical protein
MWAKPSTRAGNGGESYQVQERRKSNRQPLGAAGLLTAEGNSQFKSQLQVLVVDVSLGGVGFRSPVAFRSGSIFALRIGSGPLHLSGRIRIISSRDREDGTYDVGAKFI